MAQRERHDTVDEDLEQWAFKIRQKLEGIDREEPRQNVRGVEMEAAGFQAVESAPNRARHFAWLAILAPKRIWTEDVGDALETICAMERNGCSRVKIGVKIVMTYLWVLIAVVRELVAALTGRKSPHR